MENITLRILILFFNSCSALKILDSQFVFKKSTSHQGRRFIHRTSEHICIVFYHCGLLEHLRSSGCPELSHHCWSFNSPVCNLDILAFLCGKTDTLYLSTQGRNWAIP